MKGHFKVSLLSSEGFSDDDFIIAKKNNKILDLVNSLELKRNIVHGNLILQTLPHWIFYSAMGGLQPPSPFHYDAFINAGLGFICLLSTDTEPDYNIHYTNQHTKIHTVSDSVDTSYGGKRFIEDDIIDSEANLISTKESLFLRSSFLYLPREAVSSGIKSIGVYWAHDVDILPTNSTSNGLFARIRLKDSDGNNTIIVKTADEVLFVEYTLTFTSV